MKHGRFYTVPDSPLPTESPIVFMAGPVQGAADHQREVAETILKLNEEAIVASPRGDYSSTKEFDYSSQVDREGRHLSAARNIGILSFNFAARDISVPYDAKRSFAKTSRLEIMKVFGWMDYDPTINLAVRVDPEYVGENTRYIERELKNRGIVIQRGSNQEYGEYLAELLASNKFIS